MVPSGRWLTPPFSPRRFDTRFFLAWAPEGAEPSLPPDVDPRGREVLEARWTEPAYALSEWASDRWLLAPPTDAP